MKFLIHIFHILKALIKKFIDNIRVAENGEKLVYACVDGVRVELGDIADERPYKEDSMKVLHRIRVPTINQIV